MVGDSRKAVFAFATFEEWFESFSLPLRAGVADFVQAFVVEHSYTEACQGLKYTGHSVGTLNRRAVD